MGAATQGMYALWPLCAMSALRPAGARPTRCSSYRSVRTDRGDSIAGLSTDQSARRSRVWPPPCDEEGALRSGARAPLDAAPRSTTEIASALGDEFFEQLADHLRICAALGGLHHLPDEEAHHLLLARANGLDLLRVPSDEVAEQALQLSGVAHHLHAPLGDHRLR